MEDFKIGDTVRRISHNFGKTKVGETYVISEILEYGRTIFIKRGIRILGDSIYEYDSMYFKKVKFFIPKNLKII